jgi:DNA adenine methylase
MIRNLVKQAPNLKDITFINKSFEELDAVNNYVIYCDPPYRDTTKYKTKAFDYDKFYQWCRETAETNTVLVSEYSMPEDFTCIWEKEHKTYLSSTTNKKVEKLFIYNQKG